MRSEKYWKNNEITGLYLKQNVNKTKVSLKNGEDNSYDFSHKHRLFKTLLQEYKTAGKCIFALSKSRATTQVHGRRNPTQKKHLVIVGLLRSE